MGCLSKGGDMTCMCGDTNCPSCGPAQGFNPEFEVVCEWLDEVLLKDLHPVLNIDWLSEELANRLGKDQDLADSITRVAQKWSREEAKGV